MKYLTRLLPGVLLAGLLALGGCGKKEEQPTRFNQTLGETAVGVPTGTAHVDTGILRDPSAYKPASYEPLEGAAPGGVAAGGPEVQAVQTVLKDFIAAIFELDIDTLLDACVPAQVAVLREDEYVSTFYEANDTLEAFWAVLKDKAAGSEFEGLVPLIELLPELAEPIANAMTVTVLDDENAVATFDIEKFTLPEDLQARFMAAEEQLMPLMMGAVVAQMAAGGETGGPAPPSGPPPTPPDPNVAGTTPSTPGMPEMPGMPAGGFSPEMFQQMMGGGAAPGMSGFMEVVTALRSRALRKIDGDWKLVLPLSIQEEHAELINDGLLLVKDLVADLTTEIDKAETLDFASLRENVGPVADRFDPAFKNWWARAEAMLASMMEAQPGEEGAEEPEAEEEQPSEPNAPEPGPRGGRRGP